MTNIATTNGVLPVKASPLTVAYSNLGLINVDELKIKKNLTETQGFLQQKAIEVAIPRIDSLIKTGNYVGAEITYKSGKSTNKMRIVHMPSIGIDRGHIQYVSIGHAEYCALKHQNSV